MTVAAILDVIAKVETMGGDPLDEILAPGELRAIAEALLASGIIRAEPQACGYPPHLAWMAAVPADIHDCFAS